MEADASPSSSTLSGRNALLRSLHESRIKRQRDKGTANCSKAVVLGKEPNKRKRHSVVDLTGDEEKGSGKRAKPPLRSRSEAALRTRGGVQYRLLLKDKLWKEIVGPVLKVGKTDGDLRILTWNVADFDAATLVSKAAPPLWSAARNRGALLCAIKATCADVVLLQECPQAAFELDALEYDRTTSCISHCGFVHAFVRRDEDAWNVESMGAVPGSPAIHICLKRGAKQVRVITMHLHPGKDGAGTRKAQMKRIFAACKARSGNAPFVVAGDANMRSAEMCDVPPELMPVSTAPTWDSRKNKYHGCDAFAFRCTFDRVFVSPGLRAFNVKLVGDKALRLGDHQWYLSDHFGVCFDIAMT